MIASSRVLTYSAARHAPPLPTGCRPAPPPDSRVSVIGTTPDFTRGYSNRKTRQQGRQAGKEHGAARDAGGPGVASRGRERRRYGRSLRADLDSDHRSQPAAGDAPDRGESVRDLRPRPGAAAPGAATSGTRASGDADAQSRGNRVQTFSSRSARSIR